MNGGSGKNFDGSGGNFWKRTDAATGAETIVEEASAQDSQKKDKAGQQNQRRRPDIKSGRSWKWIPVILLVLIVLLVIGDSFYKVSEQEQAVLTLFGKVIDIKGAGLYFKIPIAEDVTLVDTTTKGMPIGYSTDDAYSNYGNSSTNDYIVNEHEAVMITSDFNFVDVDFYLEYRVSDPQKYLYASAQPEAVLKNLAQACIRSTVVNYTVDDVITTGKSQIQSEVRERLENELKKQDIGLSVVNLTVQDAEPPTDNVIAAFKAVETAKQGKETSVNNAKRYQNEQIPQAEAQADQVLQQAEAAKEARIAEAQGQAERFNRIYEEYAKYPDVTKKRLFYETMEDVLPQLKVIVTDGSVQSYLPLTGADMTEEAAVLDDAEPAGE